MNLETHWTDGHARSISYASPPHCAGSFFRAPTAYALVALITVSMHEWSQVTTEPMTVESRQTVGVLHPSASFHYSTDLACPMIPSLQIIDQSAELCRVLEIHFAEFVSLGLFFLP